MESDMESSFFSTRHSAAQYPDNDSHIPRTPPLQYPKFDDYQDLVAGSPEHAHQSSRQTYDPQRPGLSYEDGSETDESGEQIDAAYEHAQELRLSSNGFQGRPELTIVTSPEKRASASTARAAADPPLMTNHRNHLAIEPTLNPRRTSLVSDRSPLQNLEARLGDISKEEKRARVEEAEERARQRMSLGSSSTTAPGRSRSQTVQRKPLPQGTVLHERRDSLGLREAAGLLTSPVAAPTGHDKIIRRSSSPGQSMANSNAARPSPRTQSSSFASVRTRGGDYGHDASLTGGAAAAAVNAYQAVRRQRYDHSLPQQATFQASNTSLDISNPKETNMSQEEQSKDSSTDDRESMHQDNTNQAARNGNKGSMKRSLSARIASKFGSKTNRIVASAAVTTIGTQEPSSEQPPLIETGPIAREAVDFGIQDLNEEALGRHKSSNQQRIRFSDVVQHYDHPERRYQAPRHLEEWKTAATAVLQGDDLDLSSTEEGGRPSRNTERSRGRRLGSMNNSYQDQARTTFRPALSLKCGPLLRYAGMSRAAGREFWRGTVMVVTEDSTSMYKPVPTLKLYRQDMDLLPPPPLGIDGETGQQLAPEYIDPLAGQPTTSRTGQTLYVRPVHHLPAETDLSRTETDEGLFEHNQPLEDFAQNGNRARKPDGMSMGRFREVQGFRLHAERGVTFWRFNIHVELTSQQTRVAYCINNGPSIGFWVPAKNQMMNVIFHSCNGFSMDIDSNDFSGPDPMWRDVLNNHAARPFHCMLGGGNQIYNDAAMQDTVHFKQWLGIKDPLDKHSADFTSEMQDELEQFYLDRYSTWFSQGLFGMANSQIPMVNIWDDHDIIDGFGSYPDDFMAAPVFAGLGAVAFRFYLLFQHHSLADEEERAEPSWLLGASPGPYINQLSRSLFLPLGRHVVFLGLDCRTERMHDEILSQETYDIVFDRCRREIIAGETKHLIVLLSVPVAFPRLNRHGDSLTSRAMEPIKAMGRFGVLGEFVSKFESGVDMQDDLDDTWTAKHHQQERNWFIQELQELAAEKSVRVTILGGDVQLGAIGQFYSNPKLSIPKDRDHRYMPNVISSAIVNAPPPESMADAMNKRNKVQHLDQDTYEDMIPMFQEDVDGKQRKTSYFMPRRNWCSLREYVPGSTSRSTSPVGESATHRVPTQLLKRNDSLTRRGSKPGNLLRRISGRKVPPSAYRSEETAEYNNLKDGLDPRVDGPYDVRNYNSNTAVIVSSRARDPGNGTDDMQGRQNSFRRRPTSLTRSASRKDKSGRDGHIELRGGIEATINCEVDQKDPAGVTASYRLLIPVLFFQSKDDPNNTGVRSTKNKLADFIGIGRSQSFQRRGPGSPATEEENYGPAEQHRDEYHLTTHPSDGHENNYDGSRPFSSGQDSQFHASPKQGHERPGSEGKSQSTASHQRASIESERNQPSPSTISRLPRSQAPDEAPIFHRRHSSRKRNSIGPPPPGNIDQLPASVQRRYQQLNDGSPQSNQSSSPPSSQQRWQYTSPERGVDSEMRYVLKDRPMSSAPLPAEQDRHYYAGPMEAPLLPVNANQLRSGNKTTNIDPLLTVQSSPQPFQTDGQAGRRIVSGPAAFPEQQLDFKHQDESRNEQMSLSSTRSAIPGPRQSRYQDGQSQPGLGIETSNNTYLQYRAIATSVTQDLHGEYDGSFAGPSKTRNYGAYDRDLHQEISNRDAVAQHDVGDGNDYDIEDLYSNDGFKRQAIKPRHASGMPEKVARHFEGLDEHNKQGPSGTKGRPGGGLGGLVRRLSEGSKDSIKGWKKR